MIKKIILFFKYNMGIPFYFSYLIQNHKNIVNKLENIKNIDNLFLDSNSIIYDSINFNNYINKEQFENYIIEKVINKIEIIINLINPQKNVFIAFDGVPPLAKLNQQKNRRYKSNYQATLFNKNTPWDTCSITPGTNFMEKLDSAIYNHFKNKYTNLNLIVSGTNIPGEGEHKIFNYLRNNQNNQNNQNNTIIYGMDADLIMLCLNHLRLCKNIYLYRETPHFIKSLNSNLDKDQQYLIHINELANEIYKTITNNEPPENDELSNNKKNNYYDKIGDYIFICFLLGNDFMPHFPCLNIRLTGFTILLDLYKQLFNNNNFISINNKINYKNLKLYIKKLAENEVNFIKEIYNIREKRCKKYYPENNEEEIERKFNETPSWERNIEKFINPLENHWEFRYYYSLFNTNIDKNKEFISKLSFNYIQTLLWTYNYYNSDCTNWTHTYNYSYPPLLIDLYKAIPYFESEINLEKNQFIIHPQLLLAYVLPKKSLNLLNPNIHKYLLKNYKEYYEENYEFHYAFCKYFWEAHVNFPTLDFQTFAKNINNIIS